MNKLLITTVLYTTFCLSQSVSAKEAECDITGTGIDGADSLFYGRCEFDSWHNNGSFSLKSIEGKWQPLWDTIFSVEVRVIGKGIAQIEVADLETKEMHSWGRAKRSKADAACWIGQGFEICAR